MESLVELSGTTWPRCRNLTRQGINLPSNLAERNKGYERTWPGSWVLQVCRVGATCTWLGFASLSSSLAPPNGLGGCTWWCFPRRCTERSSFLSRAPMIWKLHSDALIGASIAEHEFSDLASFFLRIDLARISY